ncbi:hypothetical protein ABZ804_22425 [Streptomyces sp. NPDC047726]|uniref:hypothetical protein n=1 Tax=unclassified Streptomyces TaxID=2593676 RepID=UPI0033FA2E86
MTAYERVMDEQWPTGRFGRPDVRDTAAGRSALPSTPKQQAARRAALAEAQNGWRLPDERSQRNRERKREAKQPAPRHLRLVPNPDESKAA